MKNIVGKTSVVLNASAENVWEALTEPEIIKEYFFGTHAESTWKVGDPVRFSGEYNGKSYYDKGTILQSVPNKLLQYSYWSSMGGLEDEPENYATVTYNITEEGGQTVLEVIQANIPDEQTQKSSTKY